MVAPKLNNFDYKNSNPGRPPTWSTEIIEKEAALLMKWARFSDSLVLREFAALRGYGHRYMYEWSDQKHSLYNEVFRDAFEFAKSAIGARREKVDLGKSSQRDMGMYFEELEQHEREKLEFRSRLNKEEAEAQLKTLSDIKKASSEGQLSQI